MTVLVRRFGEQSVVPSLRANLSQSGLVIAFLAKFYRSLKYQPREPQSVRQVKSVFRSVLAIFIPSFQFPQDRAISKSRRTKNQISDNIYEPAFLPDLVMPEELADLIGHCEMLSLNTEVGTPLRAIRIKCATGNVDKPVYESFLVPMLTSLLLDLSRRNIQIDTERYQGLYQTVCVTYIQRHVGLEPMRPINWTREPGGCHLSDFESHDCAILDKFLANPKENVIRSARDSERRHHIEAQIKDQLNKRILKAVTKLTDQSKPIAKTRGTISRYTLEITKTEGEWRQELSSWEIRHAAAKRNIEATGSIEELQMLLSDENGLVTGLEGFGLFEVFQKSVEPVSEPLAAGNKRPRANDGFSKIHLLDWVQWI